MVITLLDEGEEGKDLWLGTTFCSSTWCLGARRINECRHTGGLRTGIEQPGIGTDHSLPSRAKAEKAWS